jgi:hypothetical protein
MRRSDLQKLKAYAKSKKIRVRFSAKHPLGIMKLSGYYNIPARVVTLSPDLKTHREERHLIHSLAHELGHASDFDDMGKRECYRHMQCVGLFNMWRFGEVFVSKKYLRKLRRVIVDLEEAAWTRGENILKKLKIEMDEVWMKKSRTKFVGTYKKVFSKHLD